MTMLLEFLERHRARHLFRSSHLKLLLRAFFLISVPDPYCKLYKQFSNTVTVTFENGC